MWACPRCSSDELEVNVSVWATLTQDDDGNLETDTSEPDDSNHEWDDESIMRCTACNYMAEAKEFEEDEDPGGELCDQCYSSDADIDHTDSAGNTVCVNCAKDEETEEDGADGSEEN